ncbi:MAG TPA: glycosyltransferase family 2 protein [Armatimonadota bacterium]|nr:glycosyltransferase family 2 protein [Armatimonadota bacterium]
MKLSIIIPVYNEKANIAAVIDAVKTVDLPKEIIVVDDGSTDGTSEILESYKDDETIRIHSSVLNFGKGTAIRVGLKYVTGDIVVIQDADLEYDPQQIPELIKPIVDGKADVVYGSRFKGSIKGMKFANWLANRILVIAANVLYRACISDEATCYKAFRADVIKSLQLKCTRFEFCPEVTAKVRKRGIPIHEIPIHYTGRTVAEGKKVTWKDGFEAIWVLIKYRFKD